MQLYAEVEEACIASEDSGFSRGCCGCLDLDWGCREGVKAFCSAQKTVCVCLMTDRVEHGRYMDAFTKPFPLWWAHNCWQVPVCPADGSSHVAALFRKCGQKWWFLLLRLTPEILPQQSSTLPLFLTCQPAGDSAEDTWASEVTQQKWQRPWFTTWRAPFCISTLCCYMREK